MPKPGELLALREDRARPLFDKWLSDENLSDKIAALSFAQHSAMARRAGWLQARWHARRREGCESGDKAQERPPLAQTVLRLANLREIMYHTPNDAGCPRTKIKNSRNKGT